MTLITDPLDALRERYPAWRIWRTSVGRCWATRDGITQARWRAGCRASLDADSADQLAELIGVQEQQWAEVRS